ncbi:NADP oxidoreductase coenzyme F420-dependent domain protein [Leptospira borgpetersenii serovar Castellonis str. 200801910]|nr:NADP oxidoreductase coenzyme F420-dependent [Leptospira borgpetersenii str. 4E]EKR01193.1 NADP oxidoreductase coenzyme F420-dependent domain protein [Leptospira borgpetersenii serovar Castellonis str. 200801910]
MFDSYQGNGIEENEKGELMKGKKIGILGSGVVGQTLANGFLKYGAEVKIGTRDPENSKIGYPRREQVHRSGHLQTPQISEKFLC